MEYPNEISPIMFNNSNNLYIVFNEKWFQIKGEHSSSNNFNSNVASLAFKNCTFHDLNSSILNEDVMANLQSLSISSNLETLNETSFNQLANLIEMTLELENMNDFIRSQIDWIPEKRQNLTIKFKDASNTYYFPDQDFCFFTNIINSVKNISFESNSYDNLTCTLDLLREGGLLVVPFNATVGNVSNCSCNATSATTEFTNSSTLSIEISSTPTTETSDTPTNEISGTSSNETSDTSSNKTSGIATLETMTTISTSSTNTTNNSTTNATTKKPIILFFSLIGVSAALLVSVIIIIILCYKYRKLRSFKSDVAYEMNENVHYVDKFE